MTDYFLVGDRQQVRATAERKLGHRQQLRATAERELGDHKQVRASAERKLGDRFLSRKLAIEVLTSITPSCCSEQLQYFTPLFPLFYMRLPC
ncbi:MAG: hypothetical protein F6K10_43335 [Moorea sp. SIO2B7]|nr:hypothetical protein [Moorena sp. SIO2B7]